jgi:rare lipoprotein A
MIIRLRMSAFRCAVALGLGLSASAPAQTVVYRATPVLPIILDDNALSDDSIQPAADKAESTADVVYESVGQGEASYYGAAFAGRRTASGERFDPAALTAAHRTLPIGAKLRVTNLANGKSVVVRVNDRGPGARSRILDMSFAAAQQIAMIRSGTAQVKIERVRNS